MTSTSLSHEHDNATATPADTRITRLLCHTLMAVTWFLMVWGAATRAEGAGLACPDWPLCHGQIIPPVDATFYPPQPDYAVHRVYLEFIHRVLAAVVSGLTIALSVRLWRRKERKLVVALAVVLAAQVAMGAVTVLLRNAPFTVVIHLFLALTFLSVLLAARRRTDIALPAVPPRAYQGLLAIVIGQLFIGGVVSSRSIGLACFDFPLCNGLPVPLHWSGPIAWQFTHRMMGYVLALGIFGVLAAGVDRSRRAAALGITIVVQVLLGGINVWYQIPPVASAAHLGVAVVIFVLITDAVVLRAGRRPLTE